MCYHKSYYQNWDTKNITNLNEPELSILQARTTKNYLLNHSEEPIWDSMLKYGEFTTAMMAALIDRLDSWVKEATEKEQSDIPSVEDLNSRRADEYKELGATEDEINRIINWGAMEFGTDEADLLCVSFSSWIERQVHSENPDMEKAEDQVIFWILADYYESSVDRLADVTLIIE